MRKEQEIHKRDVAMARLEAEISRRILDERLSGPEALVVLTNLAGQVAREVTRMERQEAQEALEVADMVTGEDVDPAITPAPRPRIYPDVSGGGVPYPTWRDEHPCH